MANALVQNESPFSSVKAHLPRSCAHYLHNDTTHFPVLQHRVLCLWPGGGAFYIEPPSAVPLNNELAAVRGEAAAAEDNVLWRLTGQIIDNQEDIQRALDNVSMAGLFTAVFCLRNPLLHPPPPPLPATTLLLILS